MLKSTFIHAYATPVSKICDGDVEHQCIQISNVHPCSGPHIKSFRHVIGAVGFRKTLIALSIQHLQRFSFGIWRKKVVKLLQAQGGCANINNRLIVLTVRLVTGRGQFTEQLTEREGKQATCGCTSLREALCC